ncbi:hypothetical protein AC578_7758 [Pseudocercospora eumusae]|uniref:Ubiquitin-like protease family profile domain-containing protein n=1 Tax=Pseudocercospora eumusae TaxID=321146 RepID=A0A139H0V7_9PEZI|nr:hypothetical protein AC578_7758 [Pseudocercospora eumusae]
MDAQDPVSPRAQLLSLTRQSGVKRVKAAYIEYYKDYIQKHGSRPIAGARKALSEWDVDFVWHLIKGAIKDKKIRSLAQSMLNKADLHPLDVACTLGFEFLNRRRFIAELRTEALSACWDMDDLLLQIRQERESGDEHRLVKRATTSLREQGKMKRPKMEGESASHSEHELTPERGRALHTPLHDEPTPSYLHSATPRDPSPSEDTVSSRHSSISFTSIRPQENESEASDVHDDDDDLVPELDSFDESFERDESALEDTFEQKVGPTVLPLPNPLISTPKDQTFTTSLPNIKATRAAAKNADIAQVTAPEPLVGAAEVGTTLQTPEQTLPISKPPEPCKAGDAVDEPIIIDDHTTEPGPVRSSNSNPKTSGSMDHTPRRAFESLQLRNWVTGTAVTELVRLFAPAGTHIVDTGLVRVRTADEQKTFKFFHKGRPDEFLNILAPICHDQLHWTVALIRPRDHIALIYDPLQNHQYMERSKLAIQQFCDAFPSTSAAQSCTILFSADGTKQMDGSSCGVLIIFDAILRMANLPAVPQLDIPLLRYLFSVALAALHREELAVPPPPRMEAPCIETSQDLGDPSDPDSLDSVYRRAYRLASRKKATQTFLEHLSVQKSTCASLVSATAFISPHVDDTNRNYALSRTTLEVQTILAKIFTLEVQARVEIGKLDDELRAIS